MMKKIIIMLVLFLSVVQLKAQTMPQFNFKDSLSKKEQSLQKFLGDFDRLPLDDCMKGSGTVKFKLDSLYKITYISVEGNLPDTLVKIIRKRIKLTEGHWVKENKSNKNVGKCFVIPVFVDRQAGENCKNDKATSIELKILMNLFNNRNEIIETSTSYLLYPFIIASAK